MTGILATNGQAIRCGDVVIDHEAGVASPRRAGVVIARGFRIGQLDPGPYIKIADLDGETWELGDTAKHLQIVGFLGLEHARERRSE